MQYLLKGSYYWYVLSITCTEHIYDATEHSPVDTKEVVDINFVRELVMYLESIVYIRPTKDETVDMMKELQDQHYSFRTHLQRNIFESFSRRTKSQNANDDV